MELQGIELLLVYKGSEIFEVCSQKASLLPRYSRFSGYSLSSMRISFLRWQILCFDKKAKIRGEFCDSWCLATGILLK